jgi:hypothetical protein
MFITFPEPVIVDTTPPIPAQTLYHDRSFFVVKDAWREEEVGGGWRGGE